jgi:7-cyano-7-deazaguanine reductase
MAKPITQLGHKSVLTEEQVRAPRSILEAFDNPRPERDYQIEFSFPEFTSVCPVTGQPDFATILVKYIPDRLCVEMKSLKLYFFSYRNKGIFYESVVNAILDDLVAVLRPRYMRVTGQFAVRGGTAGTVTAEHEGRKGSGGPRASERKVRGTKRVEGNGQAGGRPRGTRSRG